ncbi:hypothetical protein [Anatilimnocola floriformis]|nr:hypothetical protein [Anatilimnocola floriformis]
MNAMNCGITAQVAGCKRVRMDRFMPNYKSAAQSPDEMRALLGSVLGFAR